MGTTPTYAWPYPDDTDPVANGAQDIEDLALAVESTVSGLPEGGLVFISRTTIGSAVSSVTVSGAFSTDYDNYKIVVSGGTASTSSNLLLTLGSTVTGYYQAGRIVNYAATTSDIHDQNVANWRGGIGGVTLSGDVTLYGPFASDYTGMSLLFFGTRGDAYEGFLGGYLADTTSYTAFTLAASAGTITGGSIDLYGYAKA